MIIFIAYSAGSIIGALCSDNYQLAWLFSEGYTPLKWFADTKELTAVLSFVVGIISPKILNLYFDDEQECYKIAVKDNDFYQLWLDSFEQEKPALYSLSTGQVYLGFNVRGPDPRKQQSWVRILPLASGYRDNETKRLQFTTYYEEIITEIYNKSPEYDGVKVSDFEVIISVPEIYNVHLFDPEIYIRHWENRET